MRRLIEIACFLGLATGVAMSAPALAQDLLGGGDLLSGGQDAGSSGSDLGGSLLGGDEAGGGDLLGGRRLMPVPPTAA